MCNNRAKTCPLETLIFGATKKIFKESSHAFADFLAKYGFKKLPLMRFTTSHGLFQVIKLLTREALLRKYQIEPLSQLCRLICK